MRWDIVFALFVCVLIISSHILVHETAHKQILAEDGHTSVIEMTPGTYGFGWQTRITDNGTVSDVAKLANMQNEIIGYTVMPFVLIFLCLYITKEIID